MTASAAFAPFTPGQALAFAPLIQDPIADPDRDLAATEPPGIDLYARFTRYPHLRHSPLTPVSGTSAGSNPEHTMSDLIYLSLTFAAFGGFAALIRILDRL